MKRMGSLESLAAAAAGLLLSFNAAAATLTTIYSFCSENNCADGGYPAAGVVLDAGGNLFGTTTFQRSGSGTAFELSQQGGGAWQYQVIYNFCSRTGCADGIDPFSDLILDAKGGLYGTNSQGGRQANGTAFELVGKGATRKLKLLHTFCARQLCQDGTNPMSGFTYAGAAAGEPYDGTSPLFGTATSGGYGVGSGGIVYELLPRAEFPWNIKILHKFCTKRNPSSCRDGDNPDAALAVSGSGDLFGITYAGGKYDSGVVFKLSFDGSKWRETVLHDFCSAAQCADGAYPMARLVMDANGNLFGTTEKGGGSASAGVVYELSPGGNAWQYSVIHTFCQQSGCADGANPYAGLSLAANGDLIGTTYHGGNAQNAGVAFRLSGGNFDVLYTFCAKSGCTDGANPNTNLTEDGGGNYFGDTVLGGAHNYGTVFRLTP